MATKNQNFTTPCEAFAYAKQQNPKACRGHARALNRAIKVGMSTPKSSRYWNRVGDRTIKRYERKTGRKFVGWGDGAFLEWLVENLPSILQIVMSIISLFAMIVLLIAVTLCSCPITGAAFHLVA